MAMTIVRVHAHTFTTSVPYSRPDMIRCGSLMESFEELLQRLMIRRVPQCFVEVDARSDRVLIRNTNTDTEQQSTTNTALDGHQTTTLGIPERSLCSWKVPCAGVESNGDISMRKFDDFIVNLGGRRPPRRVRVYNSTNNHALNNTLIVPLQYTYLVELYG